MNLKSILLWLAFIFMVIAIIISMISSKNKEILQVNAIPISNKTIVLDARTPAYPMNGVAY